MKPCEWPHPKVECPSYESLTAAQQALVEEAAVTYLWDWTGRQFGLCDVTIRPCQPRNTHWQSTFLGRGPSFGQATLTAPALVGGGWVNVVCGSCVDTCDCESPSSIALPGPVDSITMVKINNAVVSPLLYRVDNNRFLVREDGEGWPVTQDLNAPETSGNTWSVSYRRGTAVPAGGQLAASVLICELAKANAGEKDCALPKRMQSLTRNGVTAMLIDEMKDIDKGRTGIWSIDGWVASIIGLKPRSGVASVDVPQGRTRRTTWRSGTSTDNYGGGY